LLIGDARVDVTTAWTAPNSPIQRKADVDMQKRKEFPVSVFSVAGGERAHLGGLPYPMVAAADLNEPVDMSLRRFIFGFQGGAYSSAARISKPTRAASSTSSGGLAALGDRLDLAAGSVPGGASLFDAWVLVGLLVYFAPTASPE
jgi:hypothetical protein